MNGRQTSLPAHQRFQEDFFRSLQGMQSTRSSQWTRGYVMKLRLSGHNEA